MKLKQLYILLYFICLTFTFACDYIQTNKPKENETPIARVYNRYLYKSDLDNIGLNNKQLQNAFINNWVKQQLFLQKAESNLHADLIDIEKQVDDYRNNLKSYNYEKYLIRQNLETTVNETLISDYYQAHKNQFKLKENVFKPKYIKVNVDDEMGDSLSNWIISEDDYFVEKFNTYALQHSNNYCLGSDWFTIKEFVYNLPFNKLSDKDLMQQNKLLKKQLNNELHLLYVTAFGEQEQIAPLDFKRKEIKNIILNKRKINYIENVKKTIYNDAIDKNEIELYK